MKRLIIIGASGHGKVVCDIASLCGYSEILFLDDAPTAEFCLGGFRFAGTPMFSAAAITVQLFMQFSRLKKT